MPPSSTCGGSPSSSRSAGLPAPGHRYRPRGRRRVVHDRGGRDPGTGRRVGLRQDHHRPLHPARDVALARRDPVPNCRRQRRGPGAAVARGPPSAEAADPDDLPGPVRLPEPADDDLRQRGRTAPGQRHALASRPARARDRAAGADRPATGVHASLPARVLGGPAPAHRHRPCAGHRTAAGGGRRAGLRARRLGPLAKC